MADFLTPGISEVGARAQLATETKDLSRLKELKSQDVRDVEEADKASRQFEALLLHQMMKAMWSTVNHTGLFGEDSNQAQIYQDMLNQAIADSISEGSGIGVGDVIKTELLKKKGASK